MVDNTRDRFSARPLWHDPPAILVCLAAGSTQSGGGGAVEAPSRRPRHSTPRPGSVARPAASRASVRPRLAASSSGAPSRPAYAAAWSSCRGYPPPPGASGPGGSHDRPAPPPDRRAWAWPASRPPRPASAWPQTCPNSCGPFPPSRRSCLGCLVGRPVAAPLGRFLRLLKTWKQDSTSPEPR